MAEPSELPVDYVKLSTDGIKMVLNNDWKKAEDLFAEHKDSSVLMCAGNSFVTFLQALMTFEEDKLEQAKTALNETINRCKNAASSKHRKHSNKETLSSEDRLLYEVIATDCLLYQAGLIVINQDMKSYIKGGWYLRSAWRSYKRLYNEIRALNPEQDDQFFTGKESSIDPMEDSLAVPSSSEDWPFPTSSSSSSIAATPDEFRDLELDFARSRSMSSMTSELSRSSKDRLLAAVCFGYGSFQLFISLCPPKILGIIHFLGFEGDQELSLKCLDFTSRMDGMMAPLATLVLVYYHSVIRPFFALDGSNLSAGISEANRILERADLDYPDSALFLYFRSRVHILEGRADEGLVTCRRALAMSVNQRETQHICLYEIGRLSMMKLQWSEAADCFFRLRKESRWARCFYAYLAAISYGCMGEIDNAKQLFIDVPKLVKLKNNQLELFVSKRATRYSANIPTENQMTILTLEMLYIWTTIPNCSKEDLEKMLTVCRNERDLSFRPLCCLVEGVILKEFEDLVEAEKSLKRAMEYYDSDHNVDAHVAAFACFELGMLKSQERNYQESRDWFVRIKHRYKNYEFEPRLSVKVSAALKRISEEEAEAQQNGSTNGCLLQ